MGTSRAGRTESDARTRRADARCSTTCGTRRDALEVSSPQQFPTRARSGKPQRCAKAKGKARGRVNRTAALGTKANVPERDKLKAQGAAHFKLHGYKKRDSVRTAREAASNSHQ